MAETLCGADEYKIGYLGPKPVTYGYAAALRFARTLLPDRPPSSISFVPNDTHDELCEAVAAGSVHSAIVAIENSSLGVISDTIAAVGHQLWTVEGMTNGLQIQGEVSLPIVHHLLSTTGKLSKLKTVHSHMSALQQCHRTIRRLNAIRKAHGHAPLKEKWTQSTGVAADEALADSTGEIGAIASEKTIGKGEGDRVLKIVEDDLTQDDPMWDGKIVDYPDTNRTRFWVLRKPRDVAPAPAEGRSMIKTCLLSIAEHKAGVLQRILAEFYLSEDADGKSEAEWPNLTLIYALPMPNRLWEYAFFTEFVGDVTDRLFRRSFDHLLEKGLLRTPPIWLGSYPRDPDEVRQPERPQKIDWKWPGET